MPNVNDDGRIHPSFIENFPGTAFPEVRFWPYDGGRSRNTLHGAMQIIQNNIFGKIAPCNTYFSSLPGHRTFDQIWSDPTFWINWEPRPSINSFFAFTATTRPMEITVSEFCLSKGVWVTCASIVHEMAHLDGAPGLDGSGSNAAERSLLHCGLSAHFTGAIGDPTDYNNIQSRNRYT